jgi:type IX secretion system substrate protein
LPDQIDGFNYQNTNFNQVSFYVNALSSCGCKTPYIVTITSTSPDTICQSYKVDSCLQRITICADTARIYSISANGITYDTAIVHGKVIYPIGDTLFNVADSTLCCFAINDTAYQQITNNPVYTSNHVWSGKYFVSGTVTVTNNAILDLTNVDVVFDECSKIVFMNGGMTRANNSVFRPCNMTSRWQGFEFYDSRDNIIDECVFKSANFALRFFGISDTGDASNGRITNNLFYNCHVGIRVENNEKFPYSIAGNRFEIDELKPAFSSCLAGQDFDSYGIVGIFSTFKASISQNHFLNYINDPAFNSSHGIGFWASNAEISENTFTNLFRSIEMYSVNSSFTIESNEIEITSGFSNTDRQVFLQDVHGPAIIFNNEINNSNDYPAQTLQNSAIFIRGGDFINIKNNTIKGFEAGMDLRQIRSSQVIENNIKNSFYYGIYGTDLFDIDIACNEINMDFVSAVGIGVIRMDGGIIHSNCITDCENSIYLKTTNPASVLPVIQNNFLYNYVRYGIYLEGYTTGSIGVPGAPGMNTLYSNYNPAFDVFSATPTITLYDNFGMFVINWPNVQIVSNNPYHSTASCGEQIFAMPSQGNLVPKLVCDDYEIIVKPLRVGNNNSITGIEDNFIEELLKNSSELRFDKILSIQNVLCDIDINKANYFNNKVYSSIPLNSNEKAWLTYYLLFKQGQFINAQNSLNSIPPLSQEDKDLLFLNDVTLKNLNGQKNWFNLNSDEVSRLMNIKQEENIYSNYARLILRNVFGKNELYAESMLLPVYKLENNVLIAKEEFIKVLPNPAHDKITVLVNYQGQDQALLELSDLSGRSLKTYMLNFVSGAASIDIASISNGMYVLSLLDNSGFRKNVKFIKK